jgi:nucleotide-binding universal stress UspA family protein
MYIMKKILIATDFSGAASNAMIYGAQLAVALKAELFLFSAYQVPAGFAAVTIYVSPFAVMEDTRTRLNDEADKLFKSYGVQAEIICDEGSPSELITNIAAEKSVDMIVVGTRGSGRMVKKLFGSTASSLMNDLKIPVIMVPVEAKFTVPSNLLYASDVFMDTRIEWINSVLWLSDHFKSKLFVVRVVKDSYEEIREKVNTPHNLRPELKQMETSFHFPVNKNVTDGLTDYMKDQKIDLVIMQPHKREWVDRFFAKSETKAMAFHSHLPILMLPEGNAPAKKLTAMEVAEKYDMDE